MGNLRLMGLWLQFKLGALIKDEKGEVNIVATVILIGIAVVLAVFFRGQIVNLVKGMFNTINNQTKGLGDNIT